MFEIKQYTVENEQEWNAFIDKSKNGTFMLKRGYMDYHKARFEDCSLLFYLNGKLWAILPANVANHTLFSHQGLTYGGLIMSDRCTAADVLIAFKEMNEWLRERDINKVVYKTIPHIYSTQASEEDLYALFRCNATLISRGISSCIDLQNPIKWRQNRRTALNKSMHEGLKVEKTNDIHAFWQILEHNLMEKHGIKPVHAVEEMEMLMSRCPNNITLYQAIDNQGMVLGGILMYDCGKVLHSQYISATEKGKKNGAIDAIMNEIMHQNSNTIANEAIYFDFGISTENGGQYLNESLIFQKEGFGGRGICYDTYEYTIS